MGFKPLVRGSASMDLVLMCSITISLFFTKLLIVRYLISICLEKWATNGIISLKESLVETGEKVSMKSMSSHCVYPLATNRALYLSTFPLFSLLVLNTHLHPMGLYPLGRLTSSQTSLSDIDCISSLMASTIHLPYHYWELHNK